MGRREPDERPPIEILGSDPGIGTTQQVAIGRPRKPGRRGRSIAVGVAVVALVVGGAVVGGSDDDEEPTRAEDDEPRDNSDHIELGKRSTTTTVEATATTTTTVPTGPPLGTPLDGALVMWRPGGGWQVLDLATGETYDLTMPVTEPYSSAPVRDGMVVTVDGVAYFHRILGQGPEPEGIELGPADQVLSAGRDRVWLVDPPPEGPDSDPMTAVRLVEPSGGVVSSFELPGRWISEATPDGVLLQRGGRVFVADGDGLRAAAIGWLIGANGDAAVVATCDADAECSLQRQPLDGSRPEVIEAIPDPDSIYYESYEGPEGELALLRSNPGGTNQQLLLFDADGHDLGTVEVSVSSVSHWAHWLPDGRGLLVATGRGLEWARRDGDTWLLEPVELGNAGRPELFFVVSP